MYKYHIVLDFEMNPTDKNMYGLRNEIIEIGAVKLNQDLQIVDRFCCYVKQQYSYQVTPYIYHLIGIHPTQTMCADSFELSIKKLSDWIGCSDGVRIYSWSDNDLHQLTEECQVKNVDFPVNMRRWLDLQKVYPRFMGIATHRRPLALREAVKYAGLTIDKNKVHDALYDSEVTAELLVSVLSGQYIQQADCIYQYTHQDCGTSSLGDICGGVLADLLKQMELESA